MFLNCSTCFRRHPAHHQELRTAIAASGFTYVFGCRPLRWLSHSSGRQPKTYVKPETAITVLSSWWWAVCRPKHVEQLRNIGIINCTTQPHLVGSFCEIYYDNFGFSNQSTCKDWLLFLGAKHRVFLNYLSNMLLIQMSRKLTPIFILEINYLDFTKRRDLFRLAIRTVCCHLPNT